MDSYECLYCGHKWSTQYATYDDYDKIMCPICKEEKDLKRVKIKKGDIFGYDWKKDRR